MILKLAVLTVFCLSFQYVFCDKSGLRIINYYAYTNIESRFATTVITSLLRNNAEYAQKGEFALDLPEDAFISNFTMRIDGNLIVAKVMKANEAASQYNNSIKHNKTAGLVFRKNGTLFTVSTNIGSFEDIVFTLTYQEVIRKTGGEFKHTMSLDRTYFQAGTEVIAVVKIMEQGKININKIRPPDIAQTETTPVFMYSTATVIFKPNLTKNSGFEKFQVNYNIVDSNSTIEVANGYFVHFVAPINFTAGRGRQKVSVTTDYLGRVTSEVSQTNSSQVDAGAEKITVGKLRSTSCQDANLTVPVKAVGANRNQQSSWTVHSRMWICPLQPVISDVDDRDECCVFPPCPCPEHLPSTDTTEPGILEKLWAYLKIKELLLRSSDTNSHDAQLLREEALNLCLEYNFVTELTSLVVVLPESATVFYGDKTLDAVPHTTRVLYNVDDTKQEEIPRGLDDIQQEDIKNPFDGSSENSDSTAASPTGGTTNGPIAATTAQSSSGSRQPGAPQIPQPRDCTTNLVFVTVNNQISATNCPAAVTDTIDKLLEVGKNVSITGSVTVIAMDKQTGLGGVIYDLRTTANGTCPHVQFSESIQELIPIDPRANVRSYVWCDIATECNQVNGVAAAKTVCNALNLLDYKECPDFDSKMSMSDFCR